MDCVTDPKREYNGSYSRRIAKDSPCQPTDFINFGGLIKKKSIGIYRTLTREYRALEFPRFFVSECDHFSKSSFAHTPARLTAAATAVVVAERSHSESAGSRQ